MLGAYILHLEAVWLMESVKQITTSSLQLERSKILVFLTARPLDWLQEDLKSFQYRFESDRGHVVQAI
jgi:hypothetical protein